MTTLLPTPEPADPVEGQPGHFAHSNWVKQAVKDLDAGTVHKHGDTMTGNLAVQKASAQVTAEATSGNAAITNKAAAGTAYYYADAPSGQYAGLVLRNEAGKNRWVLAKANAAETGSNAGADLALMRYGDDGVYIGAAAIINRATGKVTLTGSVDAGETIQAGDSGGKVTIEVSGGRRMVTGRLADGTMRWTLRLGDVTSNAETGGNAGSDFLLHGYNDAGTLLNTPIRIYRSTGLMVLAGDPTTALGAATKQYVDNVGKWQAYTPTLTGTGFTLGASTLSGRYTRIGNTVHFIANCILGAGFVMGTSYLVMGLPPVSCSSAFSRYMANATFLKTGTGANNYWGGAYVNASGCQIVPISLTSLANTNFSPTVPFAWAAGDSIAVAGTYEAA